MNMNKSRRKTNKKDQFDPLLGRYPRGNNPGRKPHHDPKRLREYELQEQARNALRQNTTEDEE